MKLIPLTQGKFSQVDDDDYEYLSRYSWCVSTYNYAVSRMGGGKKIHFMHRVIMGARNGEEIDHKNRNPLDNRRENLRYCTHSQNLANKSMQVNSKTGYRGVDFHKARGKFRARIVVKDRSIHLGRFNTPEEAALAYNIAAKEIYGEFAFLNVIPQESI